MTTVTVRSQHNYQQEIVAGDHFIFADEPVDIGGDDTGPNPYALILGGLGACTSITLQMYARRKGWPLEGVEVELTHGRDYAQDCAECEQEDARLDRVQINITLRGDLSDEQRDRLLEIATKCPVNKTLSAGLKITHAEEK
jgi:putative redox protein